MWTQRQAQREEVWDAAIFHFRNFKVARAEPLTPHLVVFTNFKPIPV